MAGVRTADDDLADRPAQGMVYLRISVDLADDVTADQLAAITATYLRSLHGYGGYQSELDARQGWNVFAVDSADLPITDTEQIVNQARDWVALRQALQAATVVLRASITHPDGQRPVQ